MPTQIGSIDLSGQKQAFDASSQTATSYVTDITGGGVFVHPEEDNQNGVAIAGTVNIVRDGSSIAEYGSTVRIGKDGEMRLVLSADGLSFLDASGEPVAYIAIDSVRNESMFYMTRAVIVTDLRFGDWQWTDRENDNLALRWLGGE